MDDETMKQYFLRCTDRFGDDRLYAVAAISCAIPADCDCRGFPINSDGAQVYDYMTEQNASVAVSDCTLSEYARHAIVSQYKMGAFLSRGSRYDYAVYIAGANSLAYDALEETDAVRGMLDYPDDDELSEYIAGMELGKDYFPVYIVKDYN